MEEEAVNGYSRLKWSELVPWKWTREKEKPTLPDNFPSTLRLVTEPRLWLWVVHLFVLPFGPWSIQSRPIRPSPITIINCEFRICFFPTSMKFLSKCCVATTGLMFELFFLFSLSLFLNLRSHYLLKGEYLNNTFQCCLFSGDCITTTQKIYVCVCVLCWT